MNNPHIYTETFDFKKLLALNMKFLEGLKLYHASMKYFTHKILDIKHSISQDLSLLDIILEAQ